MSERRHPAWFDDLTDRLVEIGLKSGADEIEVSLGDSSEFSTDVRQGRIESLVEAGFRHVSCRIIKDKRTAYISSSDLSWEVLQHLVENAVKRAALSHPDPAAGLPPSENQAKNISDLDLFDPSIEEMLPESKIALAVETERLALKEKKITNSHGSSFETRQVETILANSNGFHGSFRETFFSLGLGLQAGETDNLVEEYWSSASRSFRGLESPETIAQKAVERTIRQLNPRKIPTQNVPVLFESRMTSWLMGFLFTCVSGIAIYQKTSFLADRLGEKVGNEALTVLDHGLMPGRLGSSPFDSEGIPCQKTPVIERGILKNYLCNTYAARKLKIQSTGNAEGSGISPRNFYLLPGDDSAEAIVSSMDRGLVLTRVIGHGLNPVTGDISRGAFGFWVEKGEIAFPVSEITISGNLNSILKELKIIGNDLEFRSSVCGPSVLIPQMTVAGETT